MSHNQHKALAAAPPLFHDEPEPEAQPQGAAVRDPSLPLQMRAALHEQRSRAGVPINPTFEAAAVSQERPHRLADGMRELCQCEGIGTRRRNLRVDVAMPFR